MDLYMYGFCAHQSGSKNQLNFAAMIALVFNADIQIIFLGDSANKCTVVLNVRWWKKKHCGIDNTYIIENIAAVFLNINNINASIDNLITSIILTSFPVKVAPNA